MKKLLLMTAVAALSVTPLFAQSSAIGVMVGESETAEHSVKVSFDHPARELFFSTDLEEQTIFKIKLGSVDSLNEFQLTDNGTVHNKGTIDYAEAIVEYRFSEVYGSTSLFAGPGFFRQNFGGFHESNYGWAAGVNGVFPVARRIAFLTEAAYHSANFDRRRSFITLTGGLQFGF